jgi:hypothetical protein
MPGSGDEEQQKAGVGEGLSPIRPLAGLPEPEHPVLVASVALAPHRGAVGAGAEHAASRVLGLNSRSHSADGRGMRNSAEKLFERYLQKVDGRKLVYTPKGQTTLIVETRQWKLSFAAMEKALFDINDEGALFVEAKAENGVHMIPWNQVLRVTVHEGHTF